MATIVAGVVERLLTALFFAPGDASSIKTLPTELILHVCTYLRPYAVFALSATCRNLRARRLLSSYPRVVRLSMDDWVFLRSESTDVCCCDFDEHEPVVTHAPPPFKRMSIDLRDIHVTDRDVARLPRVGIHKLTLYNTGISDVSLPRLANVRKLDLSFTDVTDPGLSHLTGVDTLILIGTAITDKGLVHLANVRKLVIRHTHVTDKGLTCLTNVCKLDVRDTCVSEAGRRRMRARGVVLDGESAE